MNDRLNGAATPRAASSESRRGVVRRGIGVGAALVLHVLQLWTVRSAVAGRRNKRHKKKRERCRLLRGQTNGYFMCGDDCCQVGHQYCCDERRGGSGKSCNPIGGFCCPEEIGGSCRGDQDCCRPSTQTASANLDRCPAGSPCCNTDSDCPARAGAPGPVCMNGCCVSPLQP